MPGSAVTVSAPGSIRRLDAYRLALEVVGDAARLAAVLAQSDRDLAGQLRRAVSSVPLNLAEAMRRTGRDRGRLLGVALGSAAEVRAVLDVARTLAIVGDEQWLAVDEKLDRVCAMLDRLRG